MARRFLFPPLDPRLRFRLFIGAERKRQTEHRFPKREFYSTVFGFIWLIFDKLWFILYGSLIYHIGHHLLYAMNNDDESLSPVRNRNKPYCSREYSGSKEKGR